MQQNDKNISCYCPLKVDSKKKIWWARKESIIKIQSEIVAIEGYLQFELSFCVKKKLFPFPLGTELLSTITPPIYWRNQSLFLL